MKSHIFLFLCLCFSLSVFGQKRDLSGIYHTKSGKCIKVDGDKLYLIIQQSHSPVWYNDTLAKCTFKWVDSNFIELNSMSPNIIAYEGLKVIQTLASTIKDSIKVSFSIPHQSNLKISVYTNTFKTFDLIYSKNSRELMLPSNIKTISFAIKPEHTISHTSDGLFYGIVGFDSMQEYQIEKEVNHISIELPAINDSFFEMYYVKDEYAKVSRNKIEWKGEVFIK